MRSEPDGRNRRARTGADRCRFSLAAAFVAQGIEHWFPEPGVAGSNPAEGANRVVSWIRSQIGTSAVDRGARGRRRADRSLRSGSTAASPMPHRVAHPRGRRTRGRIAHGRIPPDGLIPTRPVGRSAITSSIVSTASGVAPVRRLAGRGLQEVRTGRRWPTVTHRRSSADVGGPPVSRITLSGAPGDSRTTAAVASSTATACSTSPSRKLRHGSTTSMSSAPAASELRDLVDDLDRGPGTGREVGDGRDSDPEPDSSRGAPRLTNSGHTHTAAVRCRAHGEQPVDSIRRGGRRRGRSDRSAR